jgi:hypothetical protein
LDVTPEEVAEPQKLPDLFDSLRRLGFTYSLQLIHPGKDAIFR